MHTHTYREPCFAVFIHTHIIYIYIYTHDLDSQKWSTRFVQWIYLNRKVVSWALNSWQSGKISYETERVLTNWLQFTSKTSHLRTKECMMFDMCLQSQEVRWECTVQVAICKSCHLAFAAEFQRQPITKVICGPFFISSESCAAQFWTAVNLLVPEAVIKVGGYQSTNTPVPCHTHLLFPPTRITALINNSSSTVETVSTHCYCSELYRTVSNAEYKDWLNNLILIKY